MLLLSMTLSLDHRFEEVLKPLGDKAAAFFLAASLYHANELSYAAAAEMAGLSFDDFATKLEQHFGASFILADQVILEDIEAIEQL